MRLTIRNSDGTVSQPMDLDWSAALEKLAAYEDTGFEPEEIDFCLSGAISPQEAKERYEAHKKRYDEWFAWKQAEEHGLLVRLPCKVGSSVYTIQEDFFNCDECEHRAEAHYNPKIMRRSCNMDNHDHCPLRIVERTVGGFEVSSGLHGEPKVSGPGEWGYEGLEEFRGYDYKWYLTREEAEAALKGETEDV